MGHYKSRDGFVPPANAVGTLLSGNPRAFGGVTFRPYRVGVNRSQWRSDDQRMVFAENYRRTTFWASCDGLFVGHAFRSEKAAALAAIKKRDAECLI